MMINYKRLSKKKKKYKKLRKHYNNKNLKNNIQMNVVKYSIYQDLKINQIKIHS